MKKKLDYEIFFEESFALLCIANSEGRFIKLSKYWEEVTGYTRQELMDLPLVNFVHPDDFEDTLHEFDRIEASTGSENFTNRYITKSGDVIRLRWRSVRVDDLYYACADWIE